MKFRLLALALFSGGFAVVCVLLGFWQLRRHNERQIVVEEDRRKLAAAPLEFRSLPPLDTGMTNVVVRLSGRYDLTRQIVVMNRTRRGAPGVHILTPFLPTGGDTAVLVNRGWVYSPDGSTIDLTAWGESISDRVSDRHLSGGLTVVGLVASFDAKGTPGVPIGDGAGAKMPRVSRDLASQSLDRPLAPVQVVLLPLDTLVRAGVPVPLPAPETTAGSHLSYAVQWFAFALIAVIGFAAVATHTRRS